MIADFCAALIESTFALSAASLVVLLLRRPLRALFGARAAYAFWTLLPLAAIVTLLPEAAAPGAGRILPVLPAVIEPPMPLHGANPWMPLALLSLWILGTMIAAGIDVIRQHHFRRALGALRAQPDGTLQAESNLSAPAVLGLWRARVVVPADFEQRFDAAQRALILDHERVHVARRDLLVNLVAMVLRCAQWFNPIVHLAFARFRLDQELAADAVVLGRQPGAERRYAEALLKAQLSDVASPLGCHWQSAHPLKERILMLKRPLPGFRRATIGLASAVGLSLGFAYAAWAAKPLPLDAVANPPTYASVEAPRYPQAALDARAEGKVLLRVLVNAQGSVEQVEIDRSAGFAELDAAAVAAARTWRFNPGNNGFSPVSSWIGVPISFALTQSDEPRTPRGQESTLD